ncbi:hypothetical protein P171DRAFT_157616 [Karstenula rhodostoma CBS 690.94]|uniref:F-box domain-containing protein n=1 Tax=Karstenula rhodostoma CBS 690.94 TaxID=1392251 RepID=A0A9P4U7B3_9PLEO|nr:hypothetical protein P171DRAFT_157616 [Karstenula rhodostoma CBS 690.94]
MSILHRLPTELVRNVFNELSFKEKRSLVLVDKRLHDICAPRLSMGIGLLDMNCFDAHQARPMTTEYLAQHGNTVENLLIHYEWPLGSNKRRAQLEINFERVLDIYRGRSTLKFLGFSCSSSLICGDPGVVEGNREAPARRRECWGDRWGESRVTSSLTAEAYASIKASVETDTLPERVVLPQIKNYVGGPLFSMHSIPAAISSGAVIKIVQGNGRKPEKTLSFTLGLSHHWM